jgi:small subunit ribosomal protein S17
VSKKVLTGIVVSDKMQKTVVVEVERTMMHPVYKKFFKKHKKYHVHDDGSLAKMGDLVKIVESKPLSKTKRWNLLEVLKQSEVLLMKDGGI